MKKWIFILAGTMFFAACHHREFTLQELQKAKWDSLSPGIYYLNTKDGNNFSSGDSMKISVLDTSFTEMSEEIGQLLLSLLRDEARKSLHNSKAGYLKVNFPDMLKPDTITAIVYLKDDYDSMLLAGRDSAILKNIPGIKEVHFFSKEMAKKKYMEDGNSDWDKVLTSNPLPNSFQITLDLKDWDSVSSEKLKKDIHDRVSMSNDISFSSSAYKKTDKYFFFEYKFK
jgi:hypothetical protein